MVFSRKQLQTHGAEMDALHGPVVHAGSAERAAVATAVAQNSVGIAKTVTVFPDGIEDIFVSVGMLLVDSIGNDADPLAVIVRLSRFLVFGVMKSFSL